VCVCVCVCCWIHLCVPICLLDQSNSAKVSLSVDVGSKGSWNSKWNCMWLT